MAEHLVSEFGAEEASNFCRALNSPGPVFARANRLRVSRDELASRLAEEGVECVPGRFSPDCLVLLGRPNVYGLRAHQLGLFEIQDEGSQLLGELVGARPGESVLDLCAGNGGKTLQLASALRNRGAVYAHDVDATRLDRLMTRCTRAGVNVARVLPVVPEELRVDRVLIDAPCSSLGSLRRGPDLRFRIGPRVLSESLGTQAELLERGARAVRPGGRLVYATCTVNRAENWGQVAGFLARHPAFRIVTPGAGWLDSSFLRDSCFVALPHLHGTDGFFAAVLERST